MSSLRDLQQRFYRAVLLEQSVTVETRSRDPDARLEVYRNNARVTFTRALAATYPVVRELVGVACFSTIALTCMRDHPSRSGNLDGFGAELAQMLEVWYRDTPFAYLPDVARLEAAIAAVETAAEAPALRGLAAVAPADYPALVFELAPAARLVGSRWPVLQIWRAHQGVDRPTVDLRAGAEHALVLRRAGAVALHALDAGTFALAQRLADGEPLGDALEAAASAEFEPCAALARLGALGVLVSWRLAVH